MTKRRQDFVLVGAELYSMQFMSEQNDQDWRSRIDRRFTSLRGFAALTVMLAHYQYIGLLPSLPVFKYSGQCGLTLFFSFVVPALSFSRIGSQLGGPRAPFVDRLRNKQDLPDISAARARNRPDLLEPSVVL